MPEQYLKTPRETKLKTLSTGGYHHFGLLKGLENNLTYERFVKLPKDLELDFNIDGVPVYKSSSLSFWPILGRIHEDHQKPFVIGIFCGSKKPTPQELLEDFIKEISHGIRNGFDLFNMKIHLKVRAFIFDAPARS